MHMESTGLSRFSFLHRWALFLPTHWTTGSGPRASFLL